MTVMQNLVTGMHQVRGGGGVHKVEKFEQQKVQAWQRSSHILAHLAPSSSILNPAP